MRQHRNRILNRLVVTGFLLWSSCLVAEPWVPESDNTVLLTLSSAVQEHWQQQASSADALTPEQRITQAKALLNNTQLTGSTDGYGQAEALLLPLIHNDAAATSTTSATEAKYLLAYIKQHNHDFTEALQLLDAVLKSNPAHTAARLQRAQIQLVTAHYEQARADCKALASQLSIAMHNSCQAQVAALSGQADKAYEVLQKLLQAAAMFSADDVFELQVTAATVAEQLGKDGEAQQHYLAALTLKPDQRFVVQHLTDFYLRTGATGAALSRLQALPRDALSLEQEVSLLRALRASSIHKPEVVALQSALATKFNEASARSSREFPDKELARFTLTLHGDAATALAAAQRNWTVQKEPGDLLLLTEAARYAGDKPALAEVRLWLQSSGLQDHRINQVLQESTL